jgi:predicted RNase H-like nuclease (RuvC/YqgF family)
MIAAIIIIVLIVFIIFTFDESDNKEITWLNAKVKELEEENLNLERQLKNYDVEIKHLRRMLSVYEEYERFKLKRDEKSNKDS